MLDAITALFSLVAHTIFEVVTWRAKKIGALTLKLLPLSQQAKIDKSGTKAFILGSLIILFSIAIAWWFLVGLKN